MPTLKMDQATKKTELLKVTTMSTILTQVQTLIPVLTMALSVSIGPTSSNLMQHKHLSFSTIRRGWQLDAGAVSLVSLQGESVASSNADHTSVAKAKAKDVARVRANAEAVQCSTSTMRSGMMLSSG